MATKKRIRRKGNDNLLKKQKRVPSWIVVAQKTEEFKQDINVETLNDEQTRLYNAFVFRRAKPYNFAVTDAYSNTIRFLLYTNKTDEGVLHILEKHYNGAVGMVTANEIVNLCDVIRYGEIDPNSTDKNKITYFWKKGNHSFRLTVGLKKSNTGENILKSFYSNRKRKTSGTAGSRVRKVCGANSESFQAAKIQKNRIKTKKT